ncbi:DNA methyltransferase 1-associated protein 1 isoform X2 [Lingula anatina]|nr:DNA methyltransferase 1-associated protein 1 isoform X2 [Lingula anatina]XP_013419000.1 DNA methyltransferase 1-associated protein 1 isoform X2 [Lingula anatina]|eukprot:XP_013418999.1 DNA methyltransferase 1-associated protein 1 isoform X2 [Lingula anatina]
MDASSNDVREIMDLDGSEKNEASMVKEALMGADKKKKIKKPESSFKKPDGMHRELWGLLWTDNKDAPPIIPTDTNQGYKQMKAKIGRSKVRPWKFMPFTNPARKDGAIFNHWRRVADEGKDYPFARFNKTVDVPVYTDIEYQQHLHDENWSRQETDHLFDLCKRFSLRFIVVHDRWDRVKFPNRSVEDLKERFYGIWNTLTKVRAAHGTEPRIRIFDADHERKRKEQLIKLFNRDPEQVKEEEQLLQELKKIELRKKEREKKTQDLQKLITAADSNMESRRMERKTTKKKVPPSQKSRDIGATPESTGIKFPDSKQSGVSLRSQRMKLPATVGQKKTKAIEQVLDELAIDLNPIPTEDIVQHFNELRQDIVLLYELKLALANCEYELQTLRHRYETLAPGKVLDVGPSPASTLSTSMADIATAESKPDSPSKARKISETIDVVGPSGAVGGSLTEESFHRKRRLAAIEQSNILKKITKQKV